MIRKFQNLWQANPFGIILFSAAFFRLLAAIYSKGFGMHDDHHLVIEIAQEWIDGELDWFERGPVIYRSFFYPGLHALLFYFLELFGITDPQIKMYFARFIHAIYSLLTVIFGYFIAQRLSDEKTAKQVGLVLALFWIFPFMSVRNLIEMACVPPMMAGFYFIVKNEDPENRKNLFFAGILFALAFTIRFQTALIIAGVGLVLVFQKRWKDFSGFTGGFLLSSVILLGIPEWIAWGVPFSSFYNYVIYNFKHGTEYVVGPWYRYTLLILGIFIPPTSFLIVAGFVKSWRKLTILFWPTLLFFAAHSYFPNKQERFILPVVSLILLIGLIGWNEYANNSGFWQRKKSLIKGLWIWFWAINSILLLVLTFTYSKKNRVETLYYLSHKTDVTGIIWESSERITPFVPRFYLNANKSAPLYNFPATKSPDSLREEIAASGHPFPKYIIFLGEKRIEERVKNFEQFFTVKLKFEKQVEPSLVDDIAYRLNPRRNVNQTSNIYQIIQ